MNELVPNLRDLGGLSAADGTVKSGRLMRSALPLADDRAPESIVWPPKVVLDLRSTPELEPEHPLAATGAQVRHFPLLSALRPGVAPPDTLADLYQLMLRTTSHHLVEVVESVATSDGPTLVHCAAGKDRTGVSIALVLSLLGVDRDSVVDDYLVTAQNHEAIEARFRRMYGERRTELPNAYFATPVEAITGVLDAWHAHDGGPRGWFISKGGRDATIEQLRNTLVE